MVFFPPGGFAVADLDAAEDCMKEFALACQVTVLASGYAVAPEHPFPAAVEDAHALLSQVTARPSRVPGWTGDHLFVAGIEAGGNLAAVSALICRDRQGPRLAGQVLIMPMLDPSMTVCTQAAAQAPSALQGLGANEVLQAMSDAYRGYLPRLSDRVHPYACPLQSSRLAGLPPALLIYADGDPLGAEARAYADKLEHAGVAVERAALPASVLADAEARCAAAGEDACVAAIARFIATRLQQPRSLSRRNS
jgi:acetyl esterase/lipase